MDTRQAIHSTQAKTLDTEGMRRQFLIEEVFRPGELTMTYSHIDRIVVGGVMPLASPVGLPEGIGRSFGVDFFLQRREMGIINIGGPARIVIDGETVCGRREGSRLHRHGRARACLRQRRPGPSGEALLQLRAGPSRPADQAADARRRLLGHARRQAQRQPPHHQQIPHPRSGRDLPAQHGHDQPGGGQPVEHHADPHP